MLSNHFLISVLFSKKINYLLLNLLLTQRCIQFLLQFIFGFKSDYIGYRLPSLKMIMVGMDMT